MRTLTLLCRMVLTTTRANERMYGAGVYFTRTGCKSHQYNCTQHTSCGRCDCERTLIIASLTLGDAVLAMTT